MPVSEHGSAQRFEVEMLDPQAQLLAEIADRSLTRDDVALTYAFAIRQSVARHSARVDWTLVNHAILDRWSMNALRYIKTKAWAIAEGRSNAG